MEEWKRWNMKRPWPTKESIVLRSPAGYGDSIYNIKICIELLAKYFKQISIRTRYPSLFTWIKGMSAERWHKGGEDLCIHYSGRKREKDTNQWQDLLLAARLDKDIPFDIPWKIHNQSLLDKVKKEANGKKICLVGTPHTPFGRRDGYGLELRPKWEIFIDILNKFKKKYFFVLIGLRKREFSLANCINMDLVGKTSDMDAMDLAEISDVGIGQNGYFIPLMESRNKPIFIIYSRLGLNSKDPYISNTSPQKILSKPISKYCIDDEPIGAIFNKFSEVSK